MIREINGKKKLSKTEKFSRINIMKKMALRTRILKLFLEIQINSYTAILQNKKKINNKNTTNHKFNEITYRKKNNIDKKKINLRKFLYKT